MEPSQSITVTVNGHAVTCRVPVRRNLADFIRQDLEMTGTHVGCEHGVCGACTLRLDGVPVRGCLVLAVQADGAKVETIEGLESSGEIADLQDAFLEHNALQCGFCTPAMLITAADLLKSEHRMGRAELREAISGNYCRCTGYQAIVDAIERVMTNRAG